MGIARISINGVRERRTTTRVARRIQSRACPLLFRVWDRARVRVYRNRARSMWRSFINRTRMLGGTTRLTGAALFIRTTPSHAHILRYVHAQSHIDMTGVVISCDFVVIVGS